MYAKQYPNYIPCYSEISDFFKTIFNYREYLKQSIARDLRKRYKRSFLGYLWSMLNPLFMMIILTLVFSNLMRSNLEAYAVFLFTGQLPFVFFSTSISSSLDSIANNMNLMKQVPVPKFIFPIAIVFSNLVDFILTLAPLFLVMFVMGVPFKLSILFLPFVMLPLFLFTCGTVLLFATANVFFKDTQHLTGIILNAVYFLCPILYAREQLPEWLTKWLVLNPLFILIENMRSIFYYGALPGASVYFTSFFISIFVLIIALLIFRKAENKFIYFV